MLVIFNRISQILHENNSQKLVFIPMALSPTALLINLNLLDAVFLSLKQDQKKPHFFLQISH